MKKLFYLIGLTLLSGCTLLVGCKKSNDVAPQNAQSQNTSYINYYRTTFQSTNPPDTIRLYNDHIDYKNGSYYPLYCNYDSNKQLIFTSQSIGFWRVGTWANAGSQITINISVYHDATLQEHENDLIGSYSRY